MTLTLTYELELDILPLDRHAKIQVHMSVRSANKARRTDRQTHHVKSLTPIMSETWDVITLEALHHTEIDM